MLRIALQQSSEDVQIGAVAEDTTRETLPIGRERDGVWRSTICGTDQLGLAAAIRTNAVQSGLLCTRAPENDSRSIRCPYRPTVRSTEESEAGIDTSCQVAHPQSVAVLRSQTVDHPLTIRREPGHAVAAARRQHKAELTR